MRSPHRDPRAVQSGFMRGAGLIALSLLAALYTPSANARGFVIKDLTSLGERAASLLGSGFAKRATPSRLTLACESCAGQPIVDISLGEQRDGTEERVRSGVTKIGDLDRMCRDRSPDCRVTALDVSPAVGWISAYPLGGRAGATAVIIRDGALLTIRSLAQEPAEARSAIDKLLPLMRARMIDQ